MRLLRWSVWPILPDPSTYALTAPSAGNLIAATVATYYSPGLTPIGPSAFPGRATLIEYMLISRDLFSFCNGL
eukprot:4492977-Pleurochrysis_carterae.AAC.1